MVTRSGRPVYMVEAAEYDGQPRVRIAATQLEIPRSRANRVVDGWIALFAQGPTGIRELEFVTRTPARLFDALRTQTQLRSLTLKWGDYSDLSVLDGMTGLHELALGGAAAVTSLAPLARQRSLTSLTIEGTKRVTDYSPLGRIGTIESLSIGSGNNGPWMHTESIAFVETLPRLRELNLNLILDSGDFSPILALTGVERISLHPTRRMTPAMDLLEARVPGVARGDTQAFDITRLELVDPWDPRLVNRSPRVPEIAEELSVIDGIERRWDALALDLESRLDTIRWVRRAREAVGWADLRQVTQDGLRRLEDLIGEPWDDPPERVRRRLREELESWRARAATFRSDPHGERRRDERRLRRLAAAWAREHPDDVRWLPTGWEEDAPDGEDD